MTVYVKCFVFVKERVYKMAGTAGEAVLYEDDADTANTY